jgi:hypothetical protein
MASLHQNGGKQYIKEEDSNEIGWGTQYVRGTKRRELKRPSSEDHQGFTA